MKNATAIVQLFAKGRQREPLRRLIKSLEHLSWQMIPAVVLDASGLPLAEIARSPSAPVAAGSLAQESGCETLGDFITKDPHDGGLGWSWEQWHLQVDAVLKKAEFNIAAEDPQEVLLQFEDVVAILGRNPVSTAEYHKTKEAILIRKHSMEQKEASDRVEHTAEVSRQITASLSKAESDLAKLRNDANLREQNDADTIRRLAGELQAATTELQAKHSRIAIQLEERAFATFQAKLTRIELELEQQHELRIESLSREAAELAEQVGTLTLALQIAERRSTAYSADLVSARAELQRMTEHVANSESAAAQFNYAQANADLERMISALRAENEDLQIRNHDRETQVVELSKTIQNLEQLIGAATAAGRPMSGNEISELVGRLTAMAVRERKLYGANKKLSTRATALQNTIVTLKRRLLEARAANKRLANEAVESKGTIQTLSKQARVLTGISVAIAAMACLVFAL